GEIELDYDSKRLLVSIEEADLQIADYVFIHGGLAFQKVEALWGDVVGSATQPKMSATFVGGQDLTIFFGVNGPYWTDSNGDGEQTEEALNENAVRPAINTTDFQ